MASFQDYFTLLSHGKQVDGTEEEVLHGEPSHKQSEWGPNLLRYHSGRPTNKKSVTNGLCMTATYITLFL